MKKTGLVPALLFILFSFLSVQCPAQNKDSLLKILPALKDEKARIKIIYDILGDSGDNDPEKAFHYYKKVLEIARLMKDKVAEAVVTIEFGYAVYYTGNTVGGTEMMLKGVALAEETKNQQAIGIGYDNLSIVYEEPRKKIEMLEKALAASTAAADYTFMCWELGNLANTYSALNQPDSVMYYRQRKLELALSRKIEQSIPGALVGMGQVYYGRGQKALALEHFYAAARESFVAKDAKTASTVYGALFSYFLREDKPDSSLHYALLSREFTKNAFYTVQISPVRYLSVAYEKNNKTDSALKYLQIYNAMKDSLNDKLKSQQVQSQLLSEEEKQYIAGKERKNNLQYSAVALGVLILLISFFLFSHSTMANQRLIRFLGILSLLIVFEFLNLYLHPFLEKITHHEPLFMLIVMVAIAALLIPLHHRLEHWLTHKMVEKNNRIRLAAARKTIGELEKNENPQSH